MEGLWSGILGYELKGEFRECDRYPKSELFTASSVWEDTLESFNTSSPFQNLY